MGIAAFAAILCLQGEDLKAVPGLEKPITLKVKNQLIFPTVTSILEKAGVKYSCSKDILEKKITILVNDVSTADVLHHTFEMLDIKWRWDGKVLNLSKPRNSQVYDFYMSEFFLL